MNSCPPKPSSMPFIMSIIILLMVIVGMLVYFFMFYEPTLETCSNLYTSNICTKAVCTSLEVCPAAETVEWKPEVTSKTDRFLGHAVEENTDGAFGTAYTTGLTGLMSEFDSNVCTTLTGGSMDTTDLHPEGTDSVDQIDCIKMINKIDGELAETGLTWLEKSKLLEVRRAVIDQCTTVTDATDATPASRVYIDGFPTTALTSKTGAIAGIFCPPASST